MASASFILTTQIRTIKEENQPYSHRLEIRNLLFSLLKKCIREHFLEVEVCLLEKIDEL
jgi:hypothetical protein